MWQTKNEVDKKIWENFLQNLIAEYEKLLAKGGVTTLGQERYGTEFTATEGTSWRHYSYRQFDDAQNPVEQCSQHGPIEVYLHRHQKLLPVRANGRVWLYVNETNIFPRACPTTIQSPPPCQKWIRLSQNPAAHLRPPPSRKVTKQIPSRQALSSRILWSKSYPCPMETYIPPNQFLSRRGRLRAWNMLAKTMLATSSTA